MAYDKKCGYSAKLCSKRKTIPMIPNFHGQGMLKTNVNGQRYLKGYYVIFHFHTGTD